MGLLEVCGADLTGWDVRRDGQHGDTRPVGVEEAVDQVQVPRAATRRAHREPARDRRVRRSREGRRLLVPHVLPRQVPVAAQRVGEPVQRVAGEPVDAAYARLLQRVDDEIRGGERHWPVLPCCRRPWHHRRSSGLLVAPGLTLVGTRVATGVVPGGAWSSAGPASTRMTWPLRLRPSPLTRRATTSAMAAATCGLSRSAATALTVMSRSRSSRANTL